MLLLPNLWFAVDAEATSFEIATIQNFLFISWAASKFKDTDYYYPRSNKPERFVIWFPDQWQWPLIITEYTQWATVHRTQQEGEGGRCICLCSWNITRDRDELTLLTSQQLITTYLLNRELALLWVIKYYTNCVIMELWRQLYTPNISYIV